MSLDLEQLRHRVSRAGKTRAQCPACAELGLDRSGDHLVIMDDGRWGCVVHQGTAGAEHRRRIWELVGTRSDPIHVRPLRMPPAMPDIKGRPCLPPLRPLTPTEMGGIAEARRWCSYAGMEILTQRGLLWHGRVWDDEYEWPAWIITDSARRNAQARRLDGQPWKGIGGKKAKTLFGSDPTWPIGAADIAVRSRVILTEGGPDFLAAPLVAWSEGTNIGSIGIVGMMGASFQINADALPIFADKCVRIAVHDDEAGREAADRWARQLMVAGAKKVDGVTFTGVKTAVGIPVEDLADYATLLDGDAAPREPIFAL